MKIQEIKKNTFTKIQFKSIKIEVLGENRQIYSPWFDQDRTLLEVENIKTYTTATLIRRFELVVTFHEYPDTQAPTIPSITQPLPIQTHLQSLFKNKILTDITITVCDWADGEAGRGQSAVFNAHKCILAASSPYFERLFTVKMREYEAESICLYEIQPKIFEKILKFCYGEEIQIDHYKEACHLMRNADLMQMADLIESTSERLIQMIYVQSIWPIWTIADRYECSVLSNCCREFFTLNPIKCLGDDAWLNVDIDNIRNVLHINEPFMPEIEIYEAVIRWVNYQRELLTEEYTDMNEDNLYLSCNESSDGTTVDNECSIDILRSDLAGVMKYIRYPTMDMVYITNNIVTDTFIYNLDGMKDYIIEAYTFHFSKKHTSFRCRSRGLETG
ncbi:BTB/POZ protein [Pilobolus umbonatus]|nr:BTB/POZ protein [Pilobolus umbonatus]